MYNQPASPSIHTRAGNAAASRRHHLILMKSAKTCFLKYCQSASTVKMARSRFAASCRMVAASILVVSSLSTSYATFAAAHNANRFLCSCGCSMLASARNFTAASPSPWCASAPRRLSPRLAPFARGPRPHWLISAASSCCRMLISVPLRAPAAVLHLGAPARLRSGQQIEQELHIEQQLQLSRHWLHSSRQQSGWVQLQQLEQFDQLVAERELVDQLVQQLEQVEQLRISEHLGASASA